MNSLLVEFLFPSIIVTLFSLGILTVVLRDNPLHALLGIALMGWTVVLLCGETSARIGSTEGSVLALTLAFLVTLQLLIGVFLVRDSER